MTLAGFMVWCRKQGLGTPAKYSAELHFWTGKYFWVRLVPLFSICHSEFEICNSSELHPVRSLRVQYVSSFLSSRILSYEFAPVKFLWWQEGYFLTVKRGEKIPECYVNLNSLSGGIHCMLSSVTMHLTMGKALGSIPSNAIPTPATKRGQANL